MNQHGRQLFYVISDVMFFALSQSCSKKLMNPCTSSLQSVQRHSLLPASQNYHCVCFHYAFYSADFLDTLVDFHYVHAADDRDDVVLARDFIEGFHVRDLAYSL